MGLKTKILIGWLGIELAGISFALPTAAKVIRDVIPAPMARAVSVDLPASTGVSRFLLASDGPFVIIASNSTSPMRANVQITGDVNGNAFGKHAQNPGPEKKASEMCAKPHNLNPHIIYKSERKTADNTGPVIDQAIIMEIRYAEDQNPTFKIVTLESDGAMRTALALPCPS